jgi:hypothetical protein
MKRYIHIENVSTKTIDLPNEEHKIRIGLELVFFHKQSCFLQLSLPESCREIKTHILSYKMIVSVNGIWYFVWICLFSVRSPFLHLHATTNFM